MKLKNTHLASLICVSLLGSVALSQAEVIASDDFSGSIDAGFSSLIGKGGGTGFSNTWSEFSGYGTNIYNPAGNSLGISPARRDLTVAIGDTGTIWLSFDWSCNDDTNVANTGASQEWGTFSFFNGAAEIFAIGNPWHNNTWILNGADSGISNVGARKTAVVEFTMGAGATDSAKLWVGATGSPVNVSGAAAATVSGFDLNGVNTVRIMGTAEQTFDNLAIGTTMADVAATSGTPYSLWANSFIPPIGLPAEDDDNDGLTNQEEFAFGLLPHSGASVNPITAPLDKATGTFTYTRRAPAISGLAYNVHTSETLQENSWGVPLVLGTGYSEEILSTVNDVQTVKVTLIPEPTAAKLFIQVRAN